MYFSLPVLLFPFAFSLHALVAAAPVPTKSTFTFGLPHYQGEMTGKDGNLHPDLQQHIADSQHLQNVEGEVRNQIDALHGHVQHAIANPSAPLHPSISQNFGNSPDLHAISHKLTAMGSGSTAVSHIRDHNMGPETLAVHNSAHGIRFHPDFHKLPVPVAASVAIHELSHGQGTKDYHYHGHPLGPDGQPQTHLPKAWHAIGADEVEKHKPHGEIREGYMDNHADHKHLVDHASHHTHLNADSYFGAAHQALHGANVNPQHALDQHWKRPQSQPGSPTRPGSRNSDQWEEWKAKGGVGAHPGATHKRG